MRVRIKFCGMTRREDLERAAELGVDAVGMVFVPGTPRHLDPGRVRDLLRGLPPFLCRVGVFADEDPLRVRRIRQELGLNAVQLHGSESPGHCAAVGGPLVKTLRVRPDWDPKILDLYDCDGFLLEAPMSGRIGGGGVPFDWRILEGGISGRRIIVAGGLTADNVEEAIRRCRPYAVDVSTGIESSPGVKDPARMTAFVEAVRRADA